MDSVDKNSTSSAFKSHCFPTIQNRSSDPSASEDGSCDRFRALFQDPNAKTELQGFCPPCDEENADEIDPLEEARKKGFERGVAAGAEDACSMAQKELEPTLDRFIGHFNNYADTYNQVTHNYSDHILKLSLAIAQKILGDRCHCVPETLEPIRNALASYLEQNYQMTLRFSPEDMKHLSELLNCHNLQLSQSTSIKLTDENGIPNGKPASATESDTIESIQGRLVKEIEQMLE